MDRKRRTRAFFLITAMLVISLLFLLALTFLSFLETDYRFSAEEDRRQRSYYLALAGLEFLSQRSDLLHPQASGPVTVIRALPPGSLSHFFEVTVESDGSVISRGIIRNPLRELNSYKLRVEPGQSPREARQVP